MDIFKIFEIPLECFILCKSETKSESPFYSESLFAPFCIQFCVGYFVSAFVDLPSTYLYPHGAAAGISLESRILNMDILLFIRA